MFKSIIAALFLTFIFISCSKQSEESIMLDAKTKFDEGVKLDSAGKIDDAKKAYGEAIKSYEKFLKDYPSSPNAPQVYINIATIYNNSDFQDFNSAIRYFKELSDKYPTTKESKFALFMIAIIYDDNLKDRELAKDAYRKFLEKYPNDVDPNDKLSASAREMLKYLEQNISIDSIISRDAKENTDTTKEKTPEQKKPEENKKIKKTEDATVPPTKQKPESKANGNTN